MICHNIVARLERKKKKSQTCTKKKITTWKTVEYFTQLLRRVTKENYWSLARPGQREVLFFSFPIPVSYFLFLATFLGESRLLGYSTWKRSASLLMPRRILIPHVVVLAMVPLDWLFESALRDLFNPAYQRCFSRGVYKTFDLDNIQPL